MPLDDALRISATGSTITVSGASANVAIPNTSAGNAPRYIRLAATNTVAVKMGTSAGVTATTNDMLVQPADACIISAQGFSHVAAIQIGGVAGTLFITPLEY